MCACALVHGYLLAGEEGRRKGQPELDRRNAKTSDSRNLSWTSNIDTAVRHLRGGRPRVVAFFQRVWDAHSMRRSPYYVRSLGPCFACSQRKLEPEMEIR